MILLLTILAILTGIYGIVRMVQGDVIFGLILVILAFLIGPGGISIFT